MMDSAHSTAGAWLPLFIDVAEQPVLVVGGGVEARRKVDRLLRHGARVELLGAVRDADLAAHVEHGRVLGIDALERRDYRLIIVAERDTEAAAQAHAWAARHRIVVNAVDDPERCSALMPAIVDRAPITIAIGSAGTAPELARMIRSRIEALLPAWTGTLARLADVYKPLMRKRYPEPARRRRFLNWLFTGAPAQSLAAGRPGDAEAAVVDALNKDTDDGPGSVALVGAGPGDPELLTVRALRMIQQADVIIHDALVDRRVLEYARRDVELIDAGKRGGRCSTPQLVIHNLLLDHARQGKRVVRLKGGDPMVFGRGGEELEFLRAHSIEYSVVPGITAAAGCAAYAGIPLTHRDHAQSVHLVTAHGQQSIDRLDWRALARERQTLAFYMAVSRIDTVQAKLLRHGRDPDTPVALVENGARGEQRVLTATLARLSELARHYQVRSPAMLYVGEVAQLANTLSWWGQSPLSLDTRADAESSFEPQKQAVHG
ncbi:MAG: siroheme synthase CysG [Wenzhouxiangellaceae bacterium]|nr:siroheme synthase CysG [Wenzhouxiangellaceae bacterium]